MATVNHSNTVESKKEMSGCKEDRLIDKYHDAKHQHGLPVGASWLALVMPLCHFSQPEQVVEEIIAPLSFLLLIVPFLHSKYNIWWLTDLFRGRLRRLLSTVV